MPISSVPHVCFSYVNLCIRSFILVFSAPSPLLPPLLHLSLQLLLFLKPVLFLLHLLVPPPFTHSFNLCFTYFSSSFSLLLPLPVISFLLLFSHRMTFCHFSFSPHFLSLTKESIFAPGMANACLHRHTHNFSYLNANKNMKYINTHCLMHSTTHVLQAHTHHSLCVVRRLGLTFSPIPVIRETDIQTSLAPRTLRPLLELHTHANTYRAFIAPCWSKNSSSYPSEFIQEALRR